jgi:phospholipid/cholesterol/gamma-HCH transport system ATP-binding protein
MIMLYQGKVVAQGDPETVKKSPDPLVQQFITGAPDGPIPLRPSKTDFLEDLIGV